MRHGKTTTSGDVRGPSYLASSRARDLVTRRRGTWAEGAGERGRLASVAKDGKLRHIAIMAKSIRISDDLYDMASTEAVLMHRSIAQQVEHWAAIGQAVEATRDLADVHSASIAHMRARDHERVRRRKVTTDDLAFIPRAWVRKATVVFPKDAFSEYGRE
ncbi:MAG: hypothetical protein KF819_17140 [Labilithrix sp.]|nr:hypothetical protein [Labilithrix sp.]